MITTRRHFLAAFLPLSLQYPEEDICSSNYVLYWQDIIKKQPTSGRLHWYNKVALTMNQMICDIRYIREHMNPNIINVDAMKAGQRIHEKAGDLKEYSFRLEQVLK